MISSLELSHADHKKIFSYCEKKKLNVSHHHLMLKVQNFKESRHDNF